MWKLSRSCNETPHERLLCGLLLRVLLVRLPKPREVPAEVQFEVAPNAVADVTELATARLRIRPRQHWEDHVVARLKLGSCGHPEAIDLGLCRGQCFAAE